MNIKEVLSGTASERQVLDAAEQIRNRASDGSKLSKKQMATLEDASQISRRVFLRRAGVAGLAAAAGSITLAGILTIETSKGEPDPAFEGEYNRYLRGFEEVAKDDPQAKEYLRFFKERRRQGRFVKGKVVAVEPGNSRENFYTAVVDPDRDRDDFRNLPGFSVYRNDTNPTALFLKNVPITSVFAGTLLVHESTHVYQWLNGIEQERPNGFILGEIDAYDLEFRILDRVSDGRFRQALSEVAEGFDLFDDSGNRDFVIGGLGPEEFRHIDGVFEGSIGDDETELRMGAYIIGANFASIEDNSQTLEKEIEEKIKFTELLMSGGLGSIINPNYHRGLV